MSEAICITGVGILSACGEGKDALWSGLQEAPELPEASPRLQGFGISNRLHHLVPGDEPLPTHMGGRATRLCAEAGAEALADSGLKSLDTTGLVVGTGIGDADMAENTEASELRFGSMLAVAGRVAERLELGGPSLTISTACSSSGYAAAVAKEILEDGACDAVLAAGTEALSVCVQGNFERLGALDPVRCRPFDLNRRGTMLGEAGAAILLEPLERARARGARIYATLDGSGWSSDGFHQVAPHPDGVWIEQALLRACVDSAVAKDEIGVVFPHATGTPANDIIEGKMLERVLGRRPGVSVVKALIGHGGGAACMSSIVAATLAIYHGIVPGNKYIQEMDPEIPIIVNSDSLRLVDAPPKVVVSAYAFGGSNISLVLGRAT